MAIAISPGTMNSRYGKPSTWRIRPPSDRPKTTMKSVEEMTAASAVWVQSFETRSVSRRASHHSPAVPVTRTRLRGRCSDQIGQVAHLARAPEEVSLPVVGTHRPQLVGLLDGLDALGDDLHAERAGQ